MQYLLFIILLVTACTSSNKPEITENIESPNQSPVNNSLITNFDTSKIKNFKDCWSIYTHGNLDYPLTKIELQQLQDLAIQIPFTSIYIDSLNKADTTVFDTRNSLYNTLRIKYDMVDSNYLYTLTNISPHGFWASSVSPNDAHNEESYKLTNFKEQDSDTIIVTILNENYETKKQMVECYFTKKQNIWGVCKKVVTNFSQKTLAQNKEERLDKFLLRFTSDSAFHHNRIKFPIELNTNTDPMSDTIIYLTPKTFYFEIPEIHKIYIISNHKNAQLKKINNIMLNKVGGETGGFCYFKKIGGKWFLYRVVVVSC
jgi:hypothetical protein